jgi:hypothetical protein
VGKSWIALASVAAKNALAGTPSVSCVLERIDSGVHDRSTRHPAPRTLFRNRWVMQLELQRSAEKPLFFQSLIRPHS